MTAAAAVALATLALTVFVGFASTMKVLGRIEQRLDLLWAWYLAELGPGIAGGRRRTDPPAPWTKHAGDADRGSAG